jgi:hypothetical protein
LLTNVRNQSNKSTCTKCVLLHIFNYHDDIKYPVADVADAAADGDGDDDGKRDLNMLVINNM